MNQVELKNLRIHEIKNIKWNKKILQIEGNNGVGKTTILESIYIATNGKSFKNISNREIIKSGKDFATILLKLNNNEYSAWIDKDKIELFKNGDKLSIKDMKNKIRTFVLQTQDFIMMPNSKSYRSKFFNDIFSNLNPTYKELLKEYDTKVFLLNKIIQNQNINQSKISNLQSEITTLNNALITRRKLLVDEINEQINKCALEVQFPIIFNIDYNLVEKSNINNHNENDIFKKGLYDYKFLVEGKNGVMFESEGFNKMIVLLIFTMFAKKYQSKFPQKEIILLIDDTFSHLDNYKSNQIIKFLIAIDLNIILTSQKSFKNSDTDSIELR